MIHEADPGQPRQPRVSIVVTADAPRQSLDALVDAVERHPHRTSLEVLVVSPNGHRFGEISTDRPFVRYVAAPIGADAGELRANGIRHASGDVVVLLDADRSIDDSVLDRLLDPSTTAPPPVRMTPPFSAATPSP